MVQEISDKLYLLIKMNNQEEVNLNTEVYLQYKEADDTDLRLLAYTDPEKLKRLYNATIIMGAAAQITDNKRLWHDTHDFATRVAMQMRPSMPVESAFGTPPADANTRAQDRIRRDMIRVFGTADPE